MGICAVFCKWQRGFTIYTAVGWIMVLLVALKIWLMVNEDKSNIVDWVICVVTALVSLPSTVLTSGILCRQHCCPDSDGGRGTHQLLPNTEEPSRPIDDGADFGDPSRSAATSTYYSYDNLPPQPEPASSTTDTGADFGRPGPVDDGADFGKPDNSSSQTRNEPAYRSELAPAPATAPATAPAAPAANPFGEGSQTSAQPAASSKPVDDGSDFGAGGGASFGYRY